MQQMQADVNLPCDNSVFISIAFSWLPRKWQIFFMARKIPAVLKSRTKQ